MGNTSTNNKDFSSDDKRNIEQVIKELHYDFESFKDKDNNSNYEKHGSELFYRIRLYHPVPSFIKESDQNINDAYLIQSVKRLPKREIVDQK